MELSLEFRGLPTNYGDQTLGAMSCVDVISGKTLQKRP